MFHASRESSVVKIYVHMSLKMSTILNQINIVPKFLRSSPIKFRSNSITMIEYKKVQEDKQILILYIQSVPYWTYKHIILNKPSVFWMQIIFLKMISFYKLSNQSQKTQLRAINDPK